MTINWNNNINVHGAMSQTACGTFYGFSSTAYVDVTNPTITSTAVQEIEWIIPFVMNESVSGVEQVIGHRNHDWYFPYFFSDSVTPVVYNGTGNTVGPSLQNYRKYWLKIIRNYANQTARYDWSTDGVNYSTYTTISFPETGTQDGDPYRFGNAVYDNELNRYFRGSIFLGEVKCKVDGVDVPLHINSSSIRFNSDITFNGDFVISNEGYVAGFKPNTWLTLGMSEVDGTNPSSTLSMIFPIVRTSNCEYGREAQLGWKDKRWIIPKFVGNNSADSLYAYNNTTGTNVQVSPPLSQFQLYYIKVDWTEGIGTRTYSYSTDGTNFTQYNSFNDTTMAGETPSGPIYIGMGNPNSGETAQWFPGELDLAHTKIYANGVEIPVVISTPENTFTNQDITGVYFGTTQAVRLYLGSNLMWGTPPAS